MMLMKSGVCAHTFLDLDLGRGAGPRLRGEGQTFVTRPRAACPESENTMRPKLEYLITRCANNIQQPLHILDQCPTFIFSLPVLAFHGVLLSSLRVASDSAAGAVSAVLATKLTPPSSCGRVKSVGGFRRASPAYSPHAVHLSGALDGDHTDLEHGQSGGHVNVHDSYLYRGHVCSADYLDALGADHASARRIECCPGAIGDPGGARHGCRLSDAHGYSARRWLR